MPTFEFTSPEGKKYRIQGPDGSTKEQAFGILQQQLGGAPAASSAADQIPGGGVPGNRNVGKPAAADEPRDNLLGMLVSPVDAALSAGSAIAGSVIGPVAGVGKSILEGKYGTAKGAQDAEDFASKVASKIARPPATQTGRKILEAVGAVGEPLAALPTATLAELAGAAGNATRAVRGAAAATGATQNAADAAAVATKGPNLRDLVRAPAGSPPVQTPSVIRAAGKVASYPVNVTKAVVQPFTKKGQDSISGQIIRKFAEDGPTVMNTAELIPGSAPTLAEATGNAGIARLQSATRDLAPNRFVEREAANSKARNNAFGEVAGDQGKLDYFKQDRDTIANNLYSEAAKTDVSANMTGPLQKKIGDLLERPSIQKAVNKAKEFAAERGEKPSESGSLLGLHDTKTALDDMISKAVRDGEGGHAKALQATKDELVGVIEKLSPKYREARETYAAMSQPVNQMEVLQSLALKDSRGNITLQKVQSAIDTINKRMNKPGLDTAKSLTNDQLNTLNALRDDLLRQSNLGLGKSAGSNTFQNLATDNIISTILPGRLGEFVKDKAGGALGQIGKLAYSGPNEAIKARLIDKMLDPKLAKKDLKKPNLRDLSGKKGGN